MRQNFLHYILNIFLVIINAILCFLKVLLMWMHNREKFNYRKQYMRERGGNLELPYFKVILFLRYKHWFNFLKTYVLVSFINQNSIWSKKRNLFWVGFLYVFLYLKVKIRPHTMLGFVQKNPTFGLYLTSYQLLKLLIKYFFFQIIYLLWYINYLQQHNINL